MAVGGSGSLHEVNCHHQAHLGAVNCVVGAMDNASQRLHQHRVCLAVSCGVDRLLSVWTIRTRSPAHQQQQQQQEQAEGLKGADAAVAVVGGHVVARLIVGDAAGTKRASLGAFTCAALLEQTSSAPTPGSPSGPGVINPGNAATEGVTSSSMILATGSSDGKVRIFNLRHDHHRASVVLSGHTDRITAIAWPSSSTRTTSSSSSSSSSPSSSLYTASFDGSVRVWDPLRGVCVCVSEVYPVHLGSAWV